MLPLEEGKAFAQVGRYTLFRAIASGGMATVYVGRITGAAGFTRAVAVKRLHPQYARDPEFVSMFVDEAHLASRIRHPNVVPTLDVVATDGELFLVMEYVEGESLSRLRKPLAEKSQSIPHPIVASIVVNALHGLHAAHEARDERGRPLEIVHRDVSPQNILVGIDGASRVLDFGVAKARNRLSTSDDGHIKGKLGYMPPEQLRGEGVSRRTDIYAAGVVLWELLTNRRLFQADSEGETIVHILNGKVAPPSTHVSGAAPFDAIVMKALARDPKDRFPSARAMAEEIESKMRVASTAQVGDWVQGIAQTTLEERGKVISEMDAASGISLAVKSSSIAPTSNPSIHENATTIHAPIDELTPQAPRRSRRLTSAFVGVGAGVIVLALAIVIVLARRSSPANDVPVPSATPSTGATTQPDAPASLPPAVTIAPSISALAGTSVAAKASGKPPPPTTILGKKPVTPPTQTRSAPTTTPTPTRTLDPFETR